MSPSIFEDVVDCEETGIWTEVERTTEVAAHEDGVEECGRSKCEFRGVGVGTDVYVCKNVSSNGCKAAFCVLGINDWKEFTAARWNS